MRKFTMTSAALAIAAMAAPPTFAASAVTAWSASGTCSYFQVDKSQPWYVINTVTYPNVTGTVFAAFQAYQLLGVGASVPPQAATIGIWGTADDSDCPGYISVTGVNAGNAQ